MIINTTAVNNSLYTDQYLPIGYYFVLNGTSDNTNASLLPNINANIKSNGDTIANTNGRSNNNFNSLINSLVSVYGFYFMDTLVDSFSFKALLKNVTLTTSSFNGVYGNNVVLSGILKSNGVVVANKFVEVWLNGKRVAILKTDNKGVTTYIHKVGQTGNSVVEFKFNGDDIHNITSVKSVLSVNKFSSLGIVNTVKLRSSQTLLSSVIRNYGPDKIKAKMTYKIGKGLTLRKITVKNVKYSYNKKTKTLTILFKNLAKNSKYAPKVYLTFKPTKKTTKYVYPSIKTTNTIKIKYRRMN